ncbi:thiamine phosphate synthase [Geodermatophilus sabuli]|uniref:Thiamine-phosphate synthase n=1 Tax=Geodermatophilus sabuli TaxID=1564158 RepID=A0A285EFE5_9ACTN|nr:thiamine phosphate synthase [Geodermatophilus sabuli]MBB3086200.1 thiamine-phosphate pyrophosphorylase [Geodermatophilus sabuli]SNX97583.1 thiamine-phosphate diphosphorylase [Geodermatophilus sabuli]
MSRFDPTLYLVTDTALCSPRPVADVVRAAVAGGVTAVQVRDKTASRRDLLALTRAVQAALSDRPDVPVVVNDAVDVALVAGADGVHVGQDDLPPGETRALLGPGPLLGVSVSSAAELDAALALPTGTVDVVGLSPVWATPTKPDAAPGLGLEGASALAAAAHAGGLVAVAIGGIDAARAADVARTGVDGICVVSAVCAAADPEAAARALRAGIAAGRLAEAHR